MVAVEFQGIVKKFGNAAVVNNVSLKIEKGELFFLLGPSGCGKTTCLRMTAGFLSPDSGALLFDGKDIGRTPPHKRNVGMVFQTYALFPHLNVEQNVAYGLRFRKLDGAEKKRRVGEMLERTRLEGLGKRVPAELSGGQQQRVALARALVIQPDVLLLDEPLSNLDARLRVEVREEIKRIHNEFKITSLYVTHDQEEALSLADRVAVMKDGQIAQCGSPRDVYGRPRNAFVAGFVGDSNILRATHSMKGERAGLDTPLGWVATAPPSFSQGAAAQISLRPECVRIAEPGRGATATVLSLSFLGGVTKAVARLADGTEIMALAPGASTSLKPGDSVGLVAEDENVVVLE